MRAREPRYKPLRTIILWKPRVVRSIIPVQVGCYGFITRSTIFFLSNIGLSKKTQRPIIKSLQEEVEAESKWIWQSSHSNSALCKVLSLHWPKDVVFLICHWNCTYTVHVAETFAICCLGCSIYLMLPAMMLDQASSWHLPLVAPGTGVLVIATETTIIL